MKSAPSLNEIFSIYVVHIIQKLHKKEIPSLKKVKILHFMPNVKGERIGCEKNIVKISVHEKVFFLRMRIQLKGMSFRMESGNIAFCNGEERRKGICRYCG
ncbi:hypothetical protein COL26_23195 [Bacillus thuringiensis]|uniref:Uncharacterized protein n=2 Tax=Bacillus cereus group TaxID=86661 RepID=A0A9X6W9M4_BACTU|nr:hypothetical protein F8510_22270 [Bacillus sp. RM2(2019)]OTW90872.1 hypothetical protein BK710_04515 [Bacillus thuringiensis serovar sumiyoshiensis]OTW98889.1 hypothetical protein BK711_15095 [Bacillus thuringiensis serovar fukuokaensis]PEB09488.1 hypothetical protein COM67_27630 [Bacillus thuringiensis]PEB55769.1 hypothetical protein COM79_21975 [Bacillus cereus]